jgi:hypothetical protein
MPPTGSTWPRSVPSPVIAASARTRMPVSSVRGCYALVLSECLVIDERGERVAPVGGFDVARELRRADWDDGREIALHGGGCPTRSRCSTAPRKTSVTHAFLG